MRHVFLALVSVLAAGCSPSQPAERPLAAVPNEAVVVEHLIDNYDEARQIAVGQCASFNKQPRLRQILYRPTGRQLAVYDCLP